MIIEGEWRETSLAFIDFIKINYNEDPYDYMKCIDNNDRIEVERAFSLAKRRYGLGLITAKLDTNTKSSIALSIIAMNVNLLTVVSFAQILVSLFSRNKLMHCTVKYMKNKSYKDLAIC